MNPLNYLFAKWGIMLKSIHTPSPFFITLTPRFVYLPTKALIYPDDAKESWVVMRWLWEVKVRAPNPMDDEEATWQRVALCNRGAAEVLMNLLLEQEGDGGGGPKHRKRPPRTVIPFRKGA